MVRICVSEEVAPVVNLTAERRVTSLRETRGVYLELVQYTACPVEGGREMVLIDGLAEVEAAKQVWCVKGICERWRRLWHIRTWVEESGGIQADRRRGGGIAVTRKLGRMANSKAYGVWNCGG